jgi:hypothetical protein
MIMSMQLLGFNNENSSQSFINDFIPTKEDQLTFSKLSNKHEEYLSNEEYESQGITEEDIENETDEFLMAFGILALDYEYDIKEKCNVPVDEDIFKKAEADCDFAGFDSFSLNKTNSESFYYLFNVYYNLMCEVNLIDENFNDQSEESFKELIRDKQEKGMPTVVQFIYYVNQ